MTEIETRYHPQRLSNELSPYLLQGAALRAEFAEQLGV